MIRITALLPVVLLTGCAGLQAAHEHMTCQTSFCVKSYPRASFNEQPKSFDTLLVLPPRFSLSYRAMNGEEKNEETEPDSMPEPLLDTMNGPAAGYQVTLSPMVAREEPQSEAVRTFYDALWTPAKDPEALIKATPVFGVPELQDPVAATSVSIPEAIRDAASDNCCILASRVIGWTDTPGARGAKIATAAIFSALPGGSGVVADGGDVLTDMAVIRISDGQVLWSSQMLGSGTRPEFKLGINPYLSTVYNAKYAP
ncbi:hypothetical protein [Alloalcanivorax gelatiniphagus]|uniref:Lipoprotein n=2 Tax=Alloalcanivorax gelatiniphagus TaxID=1194167 RepID=A0ABY2XSF6_9GAMM|nr:hypothetical protein [Alloalcanivorax gelatiniphagus]TMW14956.1 hypothetical protein FGS76_01235 [Alloalcanivorax gelatiniphagus]|tara:strand:- start:7621 stop:8388 length:768 start_codon:yes stop_codon:yes gene_type:complete